ncbi:hypothetical protein LCGC14_0855720 [marine sediment metagenome]|uniref:Uncharacterized protein n=1 Tax=marine sediment metagenome TaxID=412755 RepID=A0A0F9RTN0_9ZZZZ
MKPRGGRINRKEPDDGTKKPIKRPPITDPDPGAKKPCGGRKPEGPNIP